MRTARYILVVSILATFLVLPVFGQPAAPDTPRTVFFDSDGNEVSNNEFVEIRLANPHYKDRTVMKVADDGTVEFRLQKVPQEGMPAPKFSVSSLDGKRIDSAELAGRVAVLNFWFIGCPVCRAEMPLLNALKDKFAGENVEFIAMTADPEPDTRRFLETNRFDYRQVAEAQSVLDSFVFSGYPRNIVISKTGEIVYWRTTVKAWDKFESVIREEIAK